MGRPKNEGDAYGGLLCLAPPFWRDRDGSRRDLVIAGRLLFGGYNPELNPTRDQTGRGSRGFAIRSNAKPGRSVARPTLLRRRRSTGGKKVAAAPTKVETVRKTAAVARCDPQAVSVKIHKDCRLQEERTHPRKADPRLNPG